MIVDNEFLNIDISKY